MKLSQYKWTEASGWSPTLKSNAAASLLFIFGSTERLRAKSGLEELKKNHPNAVFFGCSTAGEILSTTVADDSVTVTAIEFAQSKFVTHYTKVRKADDSFGAGDRLGRELDKNGLKHVFAISCGLDINGSDLVRGLSRHLPEGVTITGGLSGDGGRFQETLVFGKDGVLENNIVAVLALYGDTLKVGYASLGGWDVFGPEMIVTRSNANVLYEMDGRSALELYKQYLGEHAKGLPATGLLFPLSIRTDERENAVVRTILAVNEADQSITFAGSVPQGAVAHFMKANFDRVIEGASGAAKICRITGGADPELAVLISCVGRKLILKERVEEEVRGVRKILGEKAALTGFYSYGEISPFTPGAKCELHNQTMTITTFSEKG